MTTETTPDNMDKIISKVKKLMAMTTEAGCTEAEAQSAANKVAELLADYNLDMATVEAKGIKADGGERIKDTSTSRAMYKWQQELMRVVAEVSYCYHFVTYSYVPKKNGGHRKVPAHQLVGRKVNVVSAQVMFDYLCVTIERLVPLASNSERLSRSAMSWKEGCAARVGERLADRRYKQEREQELAARKAQAEAAAAGTTATGLTLVKVKANEADANWEFANGYPEGTLAKWHAEPSRPIVTIKEEREPTEEEKRAWEKQRERWRKQDERDRKAREREWARKDHAAYNAGREAGDNIGLDPQITKGVETVRKALS